MARLLLLLAAAVLAPASAHAKDLRGRFGLGFNHSFGAASTLSARYGLPMPEPAINILVEADGGVDTTATATQSLFLGGRVLYAFVVEDNMNLYAAGGAALITGPATQTIRVQPALSAEFFLFGLENLGFTAEWGVNLDIGDKPGVTTTASPGVGLHYWF